MSTESISPGNDFYSTFQKRKNDLFERISSFDASSTPNDDNIKQLTSETQQLRKDTVEATAYLPAHDRKTLENQLVDLESRIQKLRQRKNTKGKFLFKKSASAPSPPSDKAPIPEFATNQQEVVAHTTPPVQRQRHRYIRATTLADDLKASPELSLTGLDECIVDFLERPSESSGQRPSERTTLHVKDVRNSVLVFGNVGGSVMLHGIENCIIVLKCHQLRIHNSENLTIYLDVPSHSSAIIEGCFDIAFANIPKDFWLVPQDESDEAPTTRPIIIQDFSHILSSTSPNWRFIGDDDGAPECEDLKRVLVEQDESLIGMWDVLKLVLPPSV